MHPKYKIAFLIIFVLASGRAFSQHASDTVPQVDIGDLISKVFKVNLDKPKKRPDKKFTFSVIPFVPSSSGDRSLAVSSVSGSFYLGSAETTKLSNIFFFPYFDFEGTGGFIIRPNIWTQNNKFNIVGEIRLAANSLYTYGLGTNTPESAQTTVDFGQFRFHGSLSHLVKDFFYLGGGVAVDQFYNIREVDSTGVSEFNEYGIGTSGESTSSGLTFNILRDSRKNSVNPEGGFYTSIVYRTNNGFLGSDNDWTSLYVDTRKYFSLSETRHSILAFWFFYWGTYGDVPYLDFPGTSLDFNGRSGRGYSYARYRGEQMLYFEGAYRFGLTANGLFGGVVFANIESLTQPSGKFEYVKPAVGFGLRMSFDKTSKTNLALDFGFGVDSFNFRVNLGEYF